MKSRHLLIALSALFLLIAAIEVVFFFSVPADRQNQGKTPPQITVPSGGIPRERQAAAGIKGETAKPQRHPEDNLELELLGTAIGSAKDPIAFIKDIRSNKQGIYRTGGIIREAKITQIRLGEVTLDHNGRKISLRLKQYSRSPGKPEGETGMIEMLSKNEIRVDKSMLFSRPETVINALRQVTIKPYYKADKIEGLMITGVTEGSIFARAGISDKDIITAVNNQKVNSYQKALQIFNKAKNQPEINVNLQRNGKNKNLLYHIRG